MARARACVTAHNNLSWSSFENPLSSNAISACKPITSANSLPGSTACSPAHRNSRIASSRRLVSALTVTVVMPTTAVTTGIKASINHRSQVGTSVTAARYRGVADRTIDGRRTAATAIVMATTEGWPGIAIRRGCGIMSG